MDENDISFAVRGVIYDVYVDLGPGLFEMVYEAVMAHKLIKAGFNVETQVPLPVVYDGIKLEAGYRIDLIINRKVLVEIKSVEKLAEVHHKQILTYLKLSGIKLGLLVNFNTDDILSSIHRKVNKLGEGFPQNSRK